MIYDLSHIYLDRYKMTNKATSTPHKIFQFLALGFIFIVLPGGSWYYLNEGYNYRKAILEELDQDLGTIPNFQLPNQNNKVITDKALRGKVAIVNSLSLPPSVSEQAIIQQLVKVQDQFDKRDDIVFLTFTKAAAQEEVASYFKTLDVKRNKNQWHFLTGTDAELVQIEQKMALPASLQNSVTNNSTMVIADSSSTIRYVYDFREKEAVKKLIHHIPNLMPRPKEKEGIRKSKEMGDTEE